MQPKAWKYRLVHMQRAGSVIGWDIPLDMVAGDRARAERMMGRTIKLPPQLCLGWST
jgi:hypothetical protein